MPGESPNALTRSLNHPFGRALAKVGIKRVEEDVFIYVRVFSVAIRINPFSFIRLEMQGMRHRSRFTEFKASECLYKHIWFNANRALLTCNSLHMLTCRRHPSRHLN